MDGPWSTSTIFNELNELDSSLFDIEQLHREWLYQSDAICNQFPSFGIESNPEPHTETPAHAEDYLLGMGLNLAVDQSFDYFNQNNFGDDFDNHCSPAETEPYTQNFELQEISSHYGPF
jgi:hypothetical protein